MNKICITCGFDKDLSNFYFLKKKNIYENKCKDCKIEWQKQYYKNNKKEIIDYHHTHYVKNQEILICNQKIYYEKHKEERLLYQNEYLKNHKEDKKQYDKIYRQENKIKKNKTINNCRKSQYKRDPIAKLRAVVSRNINYILKLNNGSKNGQSFTKYLPYTIQELKEHLEKQFEPWMNWLNHGSYKINNWNDNDSSTWTWQIDHIIPHSSFRYSSMKDELFKQCWSFENLRPLKSKDNLLKGNKII